MTSTSWCAKSAENIKLVC